MVGTVLAVARCAEGLRPETSRQNVARGFARLADCYYAVRADLELTFSCMTISVTLIVGLSTCGPDLQQKSRHVSIKVVSFATTAPTHGITYKRGGETYFRH